MRNVGFDVVEGANLTRDKMTEKLLDFGKKAEGADVALFFYAGHGIAVNGTNYLLPVDADLKSEMDVKLGAAINVDLTLEQTMGDAKVKLVFLDACRDNPFAAKIRSAKATRSVNVQTGLAEMKSGEGTLIAFATGPGQTALDGEAGTNSPFTRALLANIAAARRRDPAGDDQGSRAGQRGDRQGPAALGPHQPDRQRLSQSGAGTAGPRSRHRMRRLRSRGRVRSRTRVLALDEGFQQARGTQRLSDQLSERHLQIARAGPHRRAAGRSLDRDPQPDHRSGIDPATFTEEASQMTEDQLGLDRSQRRDVQRRLTGLGFDIKATGKFDEATRAVITRWQAARGYPKTGYLNALQHKALQSEILATRGSVASSNDGDDEPSRPARRRGGGGGRHYQGGGGGGGPGGLFGGMMGGLFRR